MMEGPNMRFDEKGMAQVGVLSADCMTLTITKTEVMIYRSCWLMIPMKYHCN